MIFCFSESRMAQQTSRWKFWQGRLVHITWGGWHGKDSPTWLNIQVEDEKDPFSVFLCEWLFNKWTQGKMQWCRFVTVKFNHSKGFISVNCETDLPQSENVVETQLPLKSDQQPAETEIQITWILRLWKTHRHRVEKSDEETQKYIPVQPEVYVLTLRSPSQTHLLCWRPGSQWPLTQLYLIFTEVVPEGQVQQPQQGTELDQLSLHPLHLLLKVLVLKTTYTNFF